MGRRVHILFAAQALALGAGFAFNVAFGQETAPPVAPLHTEISQAELNARLEHYIPQLMKEGDVPGLSVGSRNKSGQQGRDCGVEETAGE
jgi:hypothetical protein